jgi:hypothetical protein
VERNDVIESCIVIGAGMAGLVAAGRMQRAGVRVVVLDKGRGVGGRMATRRIEGGVFDHGAQFFTVRDVNFEAMVQHWLDEGVVREWAHGFADADGTWKRDGHPRYRGVSGMTAVPKRLARGLNVQTSKRVTAACVEDALWTVRTEAGESLRAAALLLTAPVPQSLALLDAGGYALPEADRAALDGLAYDPCIAVMALLDRPPAIPEPGGVQINDEPIRWIADNTRKGISPEAHAVTIHGAAGFSRAHWDDERAEAGRLLLDAAAGWLGDAQVLTYQTHGWLYSQPVEPYPERALLIDEGPPLAFAGDIFGAPRVEGAALSGMAAAERLLG